MPRSTIFIDSNGVGMPLPVNRYASFIDPNDIRAGVRILYPAMGITKGEAWDHLWANPPTIDFKGGQYSPLFERLPNGPNGEERHRNPYRKDHDDSHWAWIFRDIQARPALPRKPKLRKDKQPPPPRKTRYELLSDDEWFGVQDPE